MKNIEKWYPTKYTYIKGKLRASRNHNYVSVSSRLMADIIAGFYDRYVPFYARGKLIDLGCGSVPLYEVYKDRITESCCVDWTETIHNKDYIDFECDLTKKLPFNEEEFDTIILSDVLEHIPNPENLWSEMNRILKKGGILFLNVPFFYWIHEAPHDYYRYTEHALRKYCNDYGFEPAEFQIFGGPPEIITDIISKRIVRIPYIGKYAAAALQSFTYNSGSAKSLQKKSGEFKKLFPFGYGLVARKV